MFNKCFEYTYWIIYFTDHCLCASLTNKNYASSGSGITENCLITGLELWKFIIKKKFCDIFSADAD